MFYVSLIFIFKDFYFYLKNKKKGIERMYIVMVFKNKKRGGKNVVVLKY